MSSCPLACLMRNTRPIQFGRIADAAIATGEGVLSAGNRLPFGGQSAINPLLLSFAQDFDVTGTRQPVTGYQSRLFGKMIVPEIGNCPVRGLAYVKIIEVVIGESLERDRNTRRGSDVYRGVEQGRRYQSRTFSLVVRTISVVISSEFRKLYPEWPTTSAATLRGFDT